MTALETEAKAWFLKADIDLVSFNKLQGDSYTNEAALFHSQQAIEKWLKGLGVMANLALPRTHDFVRLLNLLIPQYPELNDKQWLLYCVRIQQYAVDARYPGMPLDEESVAEDIEIAKKALNDFNNYVRLKFPHLVP